MMDDCGGRSPIQQAHQLGLLQPNLLAIHCNYLAPGDAELLARNRVTVVHCPRSHHYFQHVKFPYEELASAGVNITLGTDSLASARFDKNKPPALNLWDELKQFARANENVSPEKILAMVTTNGTQILANGGRLGDVNGGERPVERGHAIEARLNAEDPDRDFAPSPGRIALLDFPSGPGIRVDTGVGEGDSIPADFDSMIAKIIAFGRDRDEALARLRRAMRETTVVIEGGACNKSFVLDLLAQPEVTDGTGGWADTSWIDRVRGEGRLVSQRHSAVALAAAAIEAYEEEERVERQRLLSTASGGRPQVQHESGRPLDLKLRGVGYRVRVARVGAHRFRVGIEAGDTVGTADVSATVLRFFITAEKPRIAGTNVAPTPDVCARNSFHQSKFTPSAAARAARLAPRCAAIASCNAIVSGSATSSVDSHRPITSHGTRMTRCSPSMNAASGFI